MFTASNPWKAKDDEGWRFFLLLICACVCICVLVSAGPNMVYISTRWRLKFAASRSVMFGTSAPFFLAALNRCLWAELLLMNDILNERIVCLYSPWKSLQQTLRFLLWLGTHSGTGVKKSYASEIKKTRMQTKLGKKAILHIGPVTLTRPESIDNEFCTSRPWSSLPHQYARVLILYHLLFYMQRDAFSAVRCSVQLRASIILLKKESEWVRNS